MPFEMTHAPEIAIDASIMRERFGNGSRATAVRALFALALAGKVKLIAWSRIKDDVPGVSFADYPITLVESNPTELGLDVMRAPIPALRETVLGGSHFESRFADLQMLASGRTSTPPDWRNWDHLHFHLVNGRRYYVTLDDGILAVAVEVGEWMKVMTVGEAVERFGASR